MSLHIIKSGRRRVVACADKIACAESGPPDTDQEKLFQAGRYTLCGMVGITEAAPGDSIAVRVHRLSLKDGLRDSPKRFLVALRDELHPLLTRALVEHSSRFRWLLPDTKVLFVAFCFKREPSGEIDLLELRFPLYEARGKPALGEPEIIAHIEGALPGGPVLYNLAPSPLQTDVLIPLLAPVDPDAADDLILASIDKAVRSIRNVSERTRAETTASTDVVVLDADGVRWLRKSRPSAEAVVRENVWHRFVRWIAARRGKMA